MARIIPAIAFIVTLAALPQAQTGAEADLKKIASDFMQVWAKGDAKGISAIYAEDAIRLPGNGQVITGRAAIEENYAQALAGPFKGSQCVITPGQTKQLSADVFVGEGKFQITGANAPAGTPTSGSYANTYVRQGGRWRIAMNAVSYPPSGK